MAAHVRLTDVSKRYHEAIVLHSLDLVVETGEVLTILGPSGSGKTTTLMLLAGIIQPTSGRIEIAGKDVTALPPYRRDIGVVFQNYALFPHLSVFDNVAFPLRRRGVARRQIAADVEQALALVHLEGLGGRHIKQLSGGQQQRVALARALVFRPALLLMDEPLGALDALTRARLQDEIVEIWRREKQTVVLVTNDVDEAILLADRIVPLDPGARATLGPAFVVDLARPRDRTALNHEPAFRSVRNAVTEYLLDVARARAGRMEEEVVEALPDLEPVHVGGVA